MLDGKAAIVTGAGSGVGRASAKRFSEEGARVAVADIDVAGAEETAAQIVAAGGDAFAVEVDVSSEDDVSALVATTVERFGRLDVIFNNVGVPTPRLGMSLDDHTMDDFHRLMAINAGGVFLGCKYAIRQFKAQGGGGAIVNTGSVAGLVGWGGTVYGATKGAVHQLTKAIAVEAAADGIRVNAICPAGMPYTGFMAAGGMKLPPEQVEQAAKSVGESHPLGRPITAEDCAEVAVFLASDRAANVTGVLVPVDGGYVAR